MRSLINLFFVASLLLIAKPTLAEEPSCTPGVVTYQLSDYDGWRAISASGFFCEDLGKWSLQEVYFDVYEDGTAHLHGDAEVVYGGCDHMGESWILDVYFDLADSNVVQPNLQPGQTNINAVDWKYWWVQPGSTIRHADGEAWADITQHPVSGEFGSQLGTGANQQNSELGLGFSFGYSHNREVGETVSGTGELSSNATLICNVGCMSDADCNDDIFCNGNEVCEDYVCVEQTPPCSDYCDESQNECLDCSSNSECDDGIYCNGLELCEQGTCVSGVPPCNEPNTCSEESNECVAVCVPTDVNVECKTDADCFDEQFCNGYEACQFGRCVSGNWPCGEHLCDEVNDSCVRRNFCDSCNVEPDAGSNPGPGSDAGSNPGPGPDAGSNPGPGSDAGSNPDPSGDAGSDNQQDTQEDLVLSGSSIWSALNCSSTSSVSFYSILALFGFVLFFRKRKAYVGLLALAFAFAPEAYANGSDHFQLTAGPNGYWVTNNPDTLEHTNTSGWVVLDYAHNPLVLRTIDGQPVRNVIEHQTSLQVGTSIGIFNFAEFGVSARGSYLHGEGFATPLRALGVGDPTFMGKVRLTPWRYGLVAAARLEGTLPLARFNGDPTVSHIMGDQYPALTPALNLGLELDIFRAALDIGQTIRYPTSLGPDIIGPTTNISAGAELELIPDVWSLTGDVYSRIGYPIFNMGFMPTPTRWSSPVEGIVGTKVQLGPVVLVGGAGTGFIQDYGTPDVRIFAGVGWAPVPQKPKPKEYREPEQKPCECEEPPEDLQEPQPEPVVKRVTKSTVVVLKSDRIEVLEPIHFEFDSAELKSESYPVLDEVARLMEEHSNIRLISIEGHTDSIGSDEYNVGLSQRRATSVEQYLLQKGIDQDRLLSKGFGEARPLVDNTTEENRAVNRRVEFIIIERAVEETFVFEEELEQKHSEINENN